MRPEKLILAFDTSAAHCAAALLCGDMLLCARYEPMAKGQAERLMPMLEEILAESGTGWSDLALVGVGVGPGNFTGVRISVAAARGLALALGVPALGVGCLEALAEGAPRPVLAALDARRGQFWLQCFHETETGQPFAASLSDLPDELRDSGLGVVGDSAQELAAIIGGTVLVPQMPLAVAIGRIAARRPLPVPRPAPVYLRSADAAPPTATPPALLP